MKMMKQTLACCSCSVEIYFIGCKVIFSCSVDRMEIFFLPDSVSPCWLILLTAVFRYLYTSAEVLYLTVLRLYYSFTPPHLIYNMLLWTLHEPLWFFLLSLCWIYFYFLFLYSICLNIKSEAPKNL